MERIRFDHCDLESNSLLSLREGLSSEFEIRPLDAALLPQCHHAKRELRKDFGDKIESYFEFGYGVCLLHRGQVVSEASAAYVAEGRIEVSVGTVEAYRRRGLASMASAHLAEETCKRGHALTWNCHAGNVESLNVARHLAFRSERPYREIYY